MLEVSETLCLITYSFLFSLPIYIFIWTSLNKRRILFKQAENKMTAPPHLQPPETYGQWINSNYWWDPIVNVLELK